MTGKPMALGGPKPLMAGGAVGIGPSASGYTYQFPAGSFTFTAPTPGRWKFVMWGPGSDQGTGPGGASGAYSEITRPLTGGQPVALVVGPGSGVDTTATFSDGKVVTAGAASGATPGAATGGDVNLAGSAPGLAGLGTGGGAAGTGSNPGTGAPGVLPFRGADGPPNNTATRAPGGGSQGKTNATGGDGMILVYLISA